MARQPRESDGTSEARGRAVPAPLGREYRQAVQAALDKAGANRAELAATIAAVTEARRPAAAFLVANMPECDLRRLSRKFLVGNIQAAFKARREAPWGKDIPEEMFLNYVLPYANVNERRDDWRGDFLERFAPPAWQCGSPAEAAEKLNRHVFRTLGVKYHASKRRKPDQSPYESIELGYASCTGLSILLVDACRAAGVPARLAGTPLWTDKSGNHTWTEVWDGQWHFLDSAWPEGLDKASFLPRSAGADPDRWQHRIYAVSYKRTEVPFPLVWDLSIRWVCATDVTSYYLRRETAAVEVPGGSGPS